MKRESHEQAIDEIAVAVQQLGYWILEGEVVKYVQAEVIGLLAGALGGGGVGAASDNQVVMAILALLGAAAGQWLGSQLSHKEVIYHVRRVYPGRWELTPVQNAAPEVGGFRPWATPS